MRHISPHNLWIGHRGDLRDPRTLSSAGITLLIDVALDEPVPSVSRELALARFPLQDGGGNDLWLIRAAIQTCADGLRADQRVMVMCSSGLSRSVAIAAAGLSRALDLSLQEALGIVTAGGGDLAPGFWRQVEQAMHA